MPTSTVKPIRHPRRVAWIVGSALLSILAGSCQSGHKSAATDQPSDLVLPGAQPHTKALAETLRATVRARAPYELHTRHRQPDGAPVFINRLALEASPYLRQHAHNPVDWYPWGDEAFAAAKRLGRPVLLSIGYSTCHWCHVMAEESFEDLEIARYLNEHYIAIKVDREELPDVDSIYMAAVMRMTGGGGWPMTVWLTPDRLPFHGDTYIPPRAGVRRAAIGFIDLLQRFSDEYTRSPATVVARSQQLTRDIQMMKTPPIGGALAREHAEQILVGSAADYRDQFDPRYGGARGAPKFPSNFPVRLLFRLHRRTRDPELLAMATATLEAMARGGIYDHVGGGFHRYTVDERWLVPHFEKMLYDNALLAQAYLEGYQVTGRADFAQVAQEIFDYVAREMTAPAGGFYSATDADSRDAAGERTEGAFFVWTPGELATALEPQDLALATALFGVTDAGNFEGRNILYRARPPAEAAGLVGLPEADANERLPAIRRALYRARAARPAPPRDDKILVGWNGLMISALARAARVLGSDAPTRSQYLSMATRAADFILDDMRDRDGLFRSYVDGRAQVPAYLDDYTFFINGLIDIFEAGGDVRYLERAVALDRVVAKHFEDPARGGFFSTSDDHDTLLAREKPTYDNAIPSGTSIAAMYLLRLYELTSDPAYLTRADKTFASLAALLERAPTAVPELLIALDFSLDTVKEIVVVAPASLDQAAPFTQVLGRTYAPNSVVRVLTSQETGAIAALMPLVRDKIAQRGQTTAYVCERQRCELPTRAPETFARQLARRPESDGDAP